MSLINLSKEYIKNFDPPFYERIRIAFDLDLYWANSLLDIEEHFRKSPPNKKDRLSSQLSAYVIINDLGIKRMYPDSFKEDDGISLSGLDDGLCFPLFEVKDETMKRLASWMAGDSSRYIKAQEEFGFNRRIYVPIPKILLQYRHDNRRGWLSITSLDIDRKPKSIRNRILELILEFPTPIPQSSY